MILRTALDAGSVVPESQDFGARALEATDPDFRLARHSGSNPERAYLRDAD